MFKYFLSKFCINLLSIRILTRGSSGCLLSPTTLTASILSLVGIVGNNGSGFDGGASFLSTTASWVSRSAFRCELLSNRTSSRAFSSLEERSAWHTSSTISQTDEHTGSTWSGGSSRRSWTCNSHELVELTFHRNWFSFRSRLVQPTFSIFFTFKILRLDSYFLESLSWRDYLVLLIQEFDHRFQNMKFSHCINYFDTVFL